LEGRTLWSTSVRDRGRGVSTDVWPPGKRVGRRLPPSWTDRRGCRLRTSPQTLCVCGQDVGGMWVRRQPNPVLRRYHSAPPNWLRRLQTARQKPMDALDKRLTLVALYDVTASACLPKAGGGRIAMMVSRSQSMTAFWTSPVCARVVLAAGGRASSRGIPDVLDDPFAAGDGPAPRPLQTP